MRVNISKSLYLKILFKNLTQKERQLLIPKRTTTQNHKNSTHCMRCGESTFHHLLAESKKIYNFEAIYAEICNIIEV